MKMPSAACVSFALAQLAAMACTPADRTSEARNDGGMGSAALGDARPNARGLPDASDDQVGNDAGGHLCQLDHPDTTSEVPPGIVVANIDTRDGRYVGSPSLLVVADGTMLASHDLFGVGQRDAPPTRVYRSRTHGESWDQIAEVEGQFWSTLFEHRGAVYLFGTSAEYGHLTIRRSTDGGETWTSPSTASSGLLRQGTYHTAPMPVVVHGGRIWRTAEVVTDVSQWGSFEASLFWADVDADLLDANAWLSSDPVPFPRTTFPRGISWLEGNVVVDRSGMLRNILRAHVLETPEVAAVLDHQSGDLVSPRFIPMPGGSKKFTIRYDAVTDLYITIANAVDHPTTLPAGRRNRLTLLWSRDLEEWIVGQTLLDHADHLRHGFQYPDWRFDGEDLVFVSRTAYDDSFGGAPNNHDANYLTFHRLRHFRRCISK